MSNYGTSTRRRPTLRLLMPGELKERYDTRQYIALLSKLPPRKTRWEPVEGPVGLVWALLL